MDKKEVRDSNGKLIGVIDTKKNLLVIKRGNATTIITVNSKGGLTVKENK